MACQAAKLDLIDPFLSTTNDKVKEDKLASMSRLILCNGLGSWRIQCVEYLQVGSVDDL